jgi:hypothetical protein
VVATADFNSDGNADLLFQNSNGDLETWLMEGISASGDPVSIGQLVDVEDKVVGTGDFDGNGSHDIVIQTAAGEVDFMLLEGTDVIGSQTFNSGLGRSPAWNVVAVGDFSGDGKPDLVFQNRNGLLATWNFDGPNVRLKTGLLSGNVTGDPAWQIIGVADYDDDGKDDIIFQHQELGLVAVWFMDGRVRVAGRLFTPGGPGIIAEFGWFIVGPR